MRIGSSLALAVATMAFPLALPAAAQSPYWNGIYVGAHAGGISVEGPSFAGTPLHISGLNGAVTGATTAAQAATMSFSDRTLSMAGVQIGYNWRLSSTLVLGVEADISGMGKGASTQTKVVPLVGFNSSTTDTTWAQAGFDHFGTLRGRLGYVVAPPLLIYATGGLAFAHTNKATVTQSVNSAALPNTNTSVINESMETGYTIGGGIEYAFTRHVSLKVEGLYYDLGTQSDSTTLANYNNQNILYTNTGLTRTQELDGAIGRLGLNYSF
jgi:outer membrane immunogenic protein